MTDHSFKQRKVTNMTGTIPVTEQIVMSRRELEDKLVEARVEARIAAVQQLIETFENTSKRVTLDRIRQFQAGQLLAAEHMKEENNA